MHDNVACDVLDACNDCILKKSLPYVLTMISRMDRGLKIRRLNRFVSRKGKTDVTYGEKKNKMSSDFFRIYLITKKMQQIKQMYEQNLRSVYFFFLFDFFDPLVLRKTFLSLHL